MKRAIGLIYFSALYDFGFLMAEGRASDRAIDCREMLEQTPKNERYYVAEVIRCGCIRGKKSKAAKGGAL